MNRLVVDAPITLAEALRRLLPDSSGRTRKQALAQGRVRVNGRGETSPTRPLRPGDRIELGAAPEAPPVGLDFGLRLRHEDEDLIVVEKPPGLLTVATAKERRRTAYAALTTHVRRADPEARVFIVHRLDEPASGLLVFARTMEAKQSLQTQLAAHSVERSYTALVEGVPQAESGAIEFPLIEDSSGRVRVSRDEEEEAGAKACRTHWRKLEVRGGHTLLEVRLESGRKHQIRVHLAALGHVIVGDEMYGSRSPAPRLMLHATTLGFTHPRSGVLMKFDAPPPADFTAALAALKRPAGKPGPTAAG